MTPGKVSQRQQPDQRAEKQPKVTNVSSTHRENPAPKDGPQQAPNQSITCIDVIHYPKHLNKIKIKIKQIRITQTRDLGQAQKYGGLNRFCEVSTLKSSQCRINKHTAIHTVQSVQKIPSPMLIGKKRNRHKFTKHYLPLPVP